MDLIVLARTAAAVEHVGDKAAGLWNIPAPWSLPFFVITTRGHAEWRNRRDDPAIASKWIDEVAAALKHLGLGTSDEVFVRSSRAGEGLYERGLFRSAKADATPESIWQAAEEIWTHAEQVVDREASSLLALVVQRASRLASQGHLSNERRVSRRSTQWKSEELSATVTARTIPPSPSMQPQMPLACPSKDHIRESLGRAAAYFTSREKRYHIEWVWDGTHIWLVQCDPEPPRPERKPGSDRPLRTPAHGSARGVLSSALAPSNTMWPKAQCVRTFQELGLPMPSIWLLDDRDALDRLASRQTVEAIRDDLWARLDFPIVIRTDLAPAVGGAGFMLPRTDCVHSAEEAQDFLAKTAAQLKSRGIETDAFCFLFHSYIAAEASSWSYARPSHSYVRVDSIWGLPDGLHYYPHDTHIWDKTRRQVVGEQIRCKEEYLDADSAGQWVKHQAGVPWDWKQAITPGMVGNVADYTTRLSEHLGTPVQLMCFARLEAEANGVLPWYFTTETIDEETIDTTSPSGYRYRIRVRGPQDLHLLEPAVREDTIVVLDPDASSVRDENFLRQVCDVLSSRRVPVLLRGSVLAHAYYILKRAGVLVFAEPQPDAQPAPIRFNKLVRDEVGAVIRRGGETAALARLDPTGFVQALKEKTLEEVGELLQAEDTSELLAELADIMELVATLAEALGADIDTVLAQANAKRESRGGFVQRQVLLETQEPPLLRVSPTAAGKMRLGDPLWQEDKRRLSGTRRLGAREAQFDLLMGSAREWDLADWLASTRQTITLMEEHAILGVLTVAREAGTVRIEFQPGASQEAYSSQLSFELDS